MSRTLAIAVLISGSGTTLRNLIIKRAAGTLDAQIKCVISSSPNAGGIEFANAANIPVVIVERARFKNSVEFSQKIFDECRRCDVDLVVMGGFLKRVKIPDDFVGKVINIHPSLIPSFSGKGFYGSRVHQAVIDYGCKVSGCTVHFVDDQYDHGPIIAQRVVEVLSEDTPSDLAARIFERECELYPEIINLIAAEQVQLKGRMVNIDD